MTRSGEYRGRCSVHMDAFSWVQRDSYLPQGARGLKSGHKIQVGIQPCRSCPEEMVKFANEQPQGWRLFSFGCCCNILFVHEVRSQFYFLPLYNYSNDS